MQIIIEYECNTEKSWTFFQNGWVNQRCPVPNTYFYVGKQLFWTVKSYIGDHPFSTYAKISEK